MLMLVCLLRSIMKCNGESSELLRVTDRLP